MTGGAEDRSYDARMPRSEYARVVRVGLVVVATVALALVVFDRGGTSGPTTSLQDPDAADVAIEVVYAEGFVTGVDPVVEVGLGDTVSITIVSDTSDQIHIHGGYDLFFNVPRAQNVSFAFIADRLGVFEVELESLDYVLFELDVG
jgi:hypothetical protein